MPITKMKEEDYPKPKLVILCAHCGKIIEAKGVIRKGKAYHFDCWSAFREDQAYEDEQTLRKEYPDLDTDVLDDILDHYDGDMDRVHQRMNANWCVITSSGGSINLDVFKTKAEMLKRIVDDVWDVLHEEYDWHLLGILYKGKSKTRSFNFKAII